MTAATPVGEWAIPPRRGGVRVAARRPQRLGRRGTQALSRSRLHPEFTIATSVSSGDFATAGARATWRSGARARGGRGELDPPGHAAHPFDAATATSDAPCELSAGATAFEGGESTLRVASARRSLSAFAPLTSIPCPPVSPLSRQRVRRSSCLDARRTGGSTQTCDGFRATHWEEPDAEARRLPGDSRSASSRR